MKKEFIPYAEALALKELGFDEECFGKYYYIKEHKMYDPRKRETFMFGDSNRIMLQDNNCNYSYDVNYIILCKAPLYQQAFRWFREKGFEIDFTFHKEYLENGDKNVYEVNVEDTNSSKIYFTTPLNGFKSYEEAELECLKKLIEIVKEK